MASATSSVVSGRPKEARTVSTSADHLLYHSAIAAGYCHRGEDGQLHFKGLVASTDGKKIYETSRTGTFNAEEGARLGREAGEELKAAAGPEFFVW